jgi:hypothetical protein
VGEEWRLVIELDAEGALAPIVNEIAAELGADIGLHRAGHTLVAYADTPEAAGAAEHHLRVALEQRALGHLKSSVEHWNHDEQQWEDRDGSPTEPPDDEGEPETGEVSWTVTVTLSHHRDAKRLSEQLTMEGWHAASSWHTVEVSTRSRADANSLVAELGVRAPGTQATIVEG